MTMMMTMKTKRAKILKPLTMTTTMMMSAVLLMKTTLLMKKETP